MYSGIGLFSIKNNAINFVIKIFRYSHTIQGIQRIFDEDKYIPSYLDDRIEMMYIIEALKVSCDANQIYLNQKYKLVNTQRFEEVILATRTFYEII